MQSTTSHSIPSQCLALDNPGVLKPISSGLPINSTYSENEEDDDDVNAKLKVYDGNMYSGKNLLPYYVTPPRQTGPTEAERKIEELTRQLEEEMEKQEEEGEYFGKFITRF